MDNDNINTDHVDVVFENSEESDLDIPVVDNQHPSNTHVKHRNHTFRRIKIINELATT